MHAQGADAAFDLFVTGTMEARAGLKPRLVTDNNNLPGLRILEGRFTAIQHRYL